MVPLSSEEYLMCHMFSDPVCASEALKKIDNTFFSKKYADFMKWAIDHYHVHGSMPTRETVLSGPGGASDAAQLYANQCAYFADKEHLSSDSGFPCFLGRVIERKISEDLNNVMGTCTQMINGDISSNSTIKEETKYAIEKRLDKFLVDAQSLRVTGRESIIHLKENADTLRQQYENNRGKDNVNVDCISFGMHMIDLKIQGMKSGLIVVGGASGHGKSMLLMNMALNAWRGNPHRGVLYISTELPASEIEHRFYCALAKIPSVNLRQYQLATQSSMGNVTPEEQRYFDALNEVKQNERAFHIIDSKGGTTMKEVAEHYEKINAEYPIDIVVVDYIADVKSSDKSIQLQDWQIIDHATKEMYEFAQLHQKMVLTASQLKGLKDDKDYYSQDRFARSRGVVNNADVVLQIGQFNIESDINRMDIMIVKNRYGASHEMICLYRDFPCFYIGNELETTFGHSAVDCNALENNSLQGGAPNVNQENISSAV